MKHKTGKVERMSISISPEMAAWLRRAASKAHTTTSQFIRTQLIPAFEARHAK
jgi:uncharacterized protein (DUF1778 family)